MFIFYYMQWKAYIRLFADIKEKIENIKNGNFQLV